MTVIIEFSSRCDVIYAGVFVWNNKKQPIFSWKLHPNAIKTDRYSFFGNDSK